jgi:hypothetical protein
LRERVYEAMNRAREISRLVLFKVKVNRGMSCSMDRTGEQRRFSLRRNKERERARKIGGRKWKRREDEE